MDKLKRLEQLIKQSGLDGFLVTNPTNIFYLTGFKGLLSTDRESYLVFSLYPTKHQRGVAKPTLITARLYQSEAKELQSENLSVAIARERNEMMKLIIEFLAKSKKVGFEQNDLLFGEYQELKKSLRVKLVPFGDLVENLRIIKTTDEIKKIEKAQIISQKVFTAVLKTLKIGQTEEEIADNLQKIIKSLGGQGLAFESIIASGPNSGKPHHATGKRKIVKGDILLLDFGAKYENYHADLSRTIFLGKASDKQKNIYKHVYDAQQKAIKKIAKGTKSNEAYHLANDHFKVQKLDEYFMHGLGHGIGLEIHEEPYLRPSGETLLQENMVFSVEPGLYFPWGGVRIEDLIVIKNGRAKVLGNLQENLIEI